MSVSPSVCVCVHEWILVCLCDRARACTYACLCVNMRISKCACVRVHSMRECVSTKHARAHHARAWQRIRTHSCARACAHTHTRTHVSMSACERAVGRVHVPLGDALTCMYVHVRIGRMRASERVSGRASVCTYPSATPSHVFMYV